MKNQLLLLEDVEKLGRSGEIVAVKAGFARNFLLPQKKAVIAEKHLLKLQERLRKAREEKAQKDRKVSLALAKTLEGKFLKVQVKIDTEGHMYGSVTQQDIIRLMKEQLDLELEKRNVVLPKPLKKIGSFQVALRLAEDVPSSVGIEITPEE